MLDFPWTGAAQPALAVLRGRLAVLYGAALALRVQCGAQLQTFAFSRRFELLAKRLDRIRLQLVGRGELLVVAVVALREIAVLMIVLPTDQRPFVVVRAEHRFAVEELARVHQGDVPAALIDMHTDALVAEKPPDILELIDIGGLIDLKAEVGAALRAALDAPIITHFSLRAIAIVKGRWIIAPSRESANWPVDEIQSIG